MITRLLGLLLAALVFWFVGRLLRAATGAQPRRREPGAGAAGGPAPGASGGPRRRIDGPMVRDKICNTFLARENALIVRDGQEEHFFCSERCRSAFLNQKQAATH